MPGPAKSDRALKVIQGTTRPDRDPLPAPAESASFEVPEPPAWLPEKAREEWRKLAPDVAAKGPMTEGRQTVLAHACAVGAKMVQLWMAGEMPSGHMLAQWRGLMSDLGLSTDPNKSSAPAKPKNRFSEFAR